MSELTASPVTVFSVVLQTRGDRACRARCRSRRSHPSRVGQHRPCAHRARRAGGRAPRARFEIAVAIAGLVATKVRVEGGDALRGRGQLGNRLLSSNRWGWANQTASRVPGCRTTLRGERCWRAGAPAPTWRSTPAAHACSTARGSSLSNTSIQVFCTFSIRFTSATTALRREYGMCTSRRATQTGQARTHRGPRGRCGHRQTSTHRPFWRARRSRRRGVVGIAPRMTARCAGDANVVGHFGPRCRHGHRRACEDCRRPYTTASGPGERLGMLRELAGVR